MAKRIPEDLIRITQRAFPTLTHSSERAPQGQNSFCFNILMKDANGNTFIIKAIRMRSATVDDPASALEEITLQA